jgi:hypothetical protein
MTLPSHSAYTRWQSAEGWNPIHLDMEEKTASQPLPPRAYDLRWIDRTCLRGIRIGVAGTVPTDGASKGQAPTDGIMPDWPIPASGQS